MIPFHVQAQGLTSNGFRHSRSNQTMAWSILAFHERMTCLNRCNSRSAASRRTWGRKGDLEGKKNMFDDLPQCTPQLITCRTHIYCPQGPLAVPRYLTHLQSCFLRPRFPP